MNLPIILGKLKICLNCKSEFRTSRKHKGKIYCSRECWKIHWKGEHTYMFGKKLPVSTIKKLSENWKGEKNPNYGKDLSGKNNARWIEDRTLLVKKQMRNDYSYHEWRRLVFTRDNWKCQINDSICSGRIEAHHILSWKDFPELRYEVKNGITLCHFHHPFKKDEEKKLSSIFQKIVETKLQK
jgi:hypothetical protein